jgi:very-short-patch-repair endonuclease
MDKENTSSQKVSEEKVVRDRSIRLFTYLRELTELNAKTTRTIDQYDIEKLQATSQTADRDRVKPPLPFDSWFEIDVFLKIAERRYRVIPQFEIAGYRIDLMIEGMEGRLAVECDGDTWHGAERFQEDMARQRMLERSGWTFWRVRGSTFYRDPDTALKTLWDTLRELKIYPTSQEGCSADSHNGKQTEFNAKSPCAEEFKDFPVHKEGELGEEISSDQLKDKKIDKFHFGEREQKSEPIAEEKRISLDDLIPFIIKILRRHGGRAHKAEVEKEIYTRLKFVFDSPWYQETVSTATTRWQNDITLAKEVAKSRGLIKRPEHSRKGHWELTEKGKR